jgi:aryl-alcohol dehydrogenase-like predicted oxidoreductase
MSDPTIQQEPTPKRRTAFGPSVSSVGIGTYLGECTETDDAAYETSVGHAIRCGINLIDTAINYRCQRSERAVGAALRRAMAKGTGQVVRESVVVCTKGGYVPLESEPPASRTEYQAYIQRTFLDQKIFNAEDLVAGGHCLTPRFLRYCVAQSRQNLGLSSIDLYYLHNPEQQLAAVEWPVLKERLRGAFGVLEEAVSRGEIGAYGCATWNAFRVPPDHKEHLSLRDLVALAREVGGDDHHFRAVQMPINLAMTEAVRAPTQPLAEGQLVPALQAAAELGVSVIASASLMQSRLASGLPDALHEHFPSCRTDAQRAVAFVRSLTGVTSALVGMRRTEHVDEAVEVLS